MGDENVEAQVQKEFHTLQIQEENKALKAQLAAKDEFINKQSNELGELRPAKEQLEKLQNSKEEPAGGEAQPGQAPSNGPVAGNEGSGSPAQAEPAPTQVDWKQRKSELISTISAEEQERIDAFYAELPADQQVITDTDQGFVEFIEGFRAKVGPTQRKSLFGGGGTSVHTPQDTANEIKKSVAAIFDKAEIDTQNSVPKIRPGSPHTGARNTQESSQQKGHNFVDNTGSILSGLSRYKPSQPA